MDGANVLVTHPPPQIAAGLEAIAVQSAHVFSAEELLSAPPLLSCLLPQHSLQTPFLTLNLYSFK